MIKGIGKIVLLLALGMLPNLAAQARHIIGGEMTYRCLGNGDYEFLLRVYRDCNCTNCAGFDPQAFIAIYQCDGDNCSALDQQDFLFRLNVPIQRISNVSAPDYPCLIPPDVCAEEAIYQFRLSDYGINLPQISGSYHIAYQRCCRNITINNIVEPDEAGATYTVEISPEAQAVCNNSPVFNQFPPTVICAGASLDFDHSAVDPEGDSLVYSFGAPLLGGASETSPNLISSCIGAAPNPACPPPYGTVRFISPTYSPEAPMAGNPVVRIDPRTGRITGTPEILGQFVVGVIVEEYRNDTLLSRISRDFQFNVAPCDPVVIADIREDRKLADQEFEINACGNLTIDFVNESFQRNFIDFQEWRFAINGDTLRYSDWEPSVTFPGVGTYEGQLILNPDTDCGDTANILVNLYPSIDADFELAYDTCNLGPVTFTDLSTTGAQAIVDWDWDFGDGATSGFSSPVHRYLNAGEATVSLVVTDNNQCQDTVSKTFNYFPVPNQFRVAPPALDVCAPGSLQFDYLSAFIDESYLVRWDFGDGNGSNEIAPWHTYTAPGSYTVSLEVESPAGCRFVTAFGDPVRVQESPQAGFRFTPESPTNLSPEVSFFDESLRAEAWDWRFSSGQASTRRNPVIIFPDTGRVAIQQIVSHPNGCRDTLVQFLDILPEVRYFLPNAFTPNRDGLNDEYRGTGILEGATDFTLSIYSRWGELMFQTRNPDEGWNGRKFNAGQEAPAGVYVVHVTYRDPRGQPQEQKGMATLIR